MQKIKWNKERLAKGKTWRGEKCYHCKTEGIRNMKKHRKSCNEWKKAEKRDVRNIKQKYFGKKKNTKNKNIANKKKSKKKCPKKKVQTL